MMIKSYKTELKPNKKQIELFAKAVGISRFIFNWALNDRITNYQETKTNTSYAKQNLKLTLLKQENIDWMYEVPKSIHQNALKHVQTAFTNFFRGLKSGAKRGFPKFKSKHRSTKSFTVDGQYYYVTEDGIKFNKFGFVHLKEKGYIPTKNTNGVKFCFCTISSENDRWFISVTVEQPEFKKKKLSKEIIGVDLGIKTLATLSDGTVIENPKAYRHYLKKLKREQRRLSRKVKGSNNRNKQRKIVANIHFKIANIRKDVIHKMTTLLAKTKPRTIVIEDLNVAGMLKNHKLAGALADVSFGEIRRQLEYKTDWYGGVSRCRPFLSVK